MILLCFNSCLSHWFSTICVIWWMPSLKRRGRRRTSEGVCTNNSVRTTLSYYFLFLHRNCLMKNTSLFLWLILTPLIILEISFDPFCKLIILDLFRSPFENAKSLIWVRCTFLVSRGQFLLCRFMTLEWTFYLRAGLGLWDVARLHPLCIFYLRLGLYIIPMTDGQFLWFFGSDFRKIYSTSYEMLS